MDMCVQYTGLYAATRAPEAAATQPSSPPDCSGYGTVMFTVAVVRPNAFVA